VVKARVRQEGSPAVDAGAVSDQLCYDQRGPGFPRTVGPQADIGAFEEQLAGDALFPNGFD
jgi:hypothetical protein